MNFALIVLALIVFAAGLALLGWAFGNTGGRMPLNALALIGGCALMFAGAGCVFWLVL